VIVVKHLLATVLLVVAEPALSQVLAESPPWSLSRVPDEKYGVGFGCKLTLSAETAEMHLTAYFLGADIEIRADKIDLEAHEGTLALYVPALDQAMTVSGAKFEGQLIRARGGEQVLMHMLEATAAADADAIVVFDGETQLGGFMSVGLSNIMPQMRACFQSL
jgi:hypothetical protein